MNMFFNHIIPILVVNQTQKEMSAHGRFFRIVDELKRENIV